MSTPNDPKPDRGYIPLADHGLIGNLRTAALVSTDGSIESYCVPNFDSPSIFARILDDKKGGHFSITPTIPFTSKQNYIPNSNVNYLPRQAKSATTKPLLTWLIRRVEVIRGTMPLRMECAPAFDYARAPHTTEIVPDPSIPAIYKSSSPSSAPAHAKVRFSSPAAKLTLDLRFVAESLLENVDAPRVALHELDLRAQGHRGAGALAEFEMGEGQVVTWVLRIPPAEAEGGGPRGAEPTPEKASEMGVSFEQLVMGASDLRPPEDPFLTKQLLQRLLDATNQYWNAWIRQSTYEGAWKEAVHRSALALKLLIYEPTGAVVASPTFSLPEYIGGTRNWDYRASWIRDSSFTLYALIRLAYMEFILARLRTKNPDGSLSIMSVKNFPEEELTHLDGHKGSKPYGKPLVSDCKVSANVIANCKQPDLEVRNRHRHFTVRLRLADKRSLPCPRRLQWLAARDELYEEIMTKAWNPEGRFFAQSYEDLEILDSSLLIMPLVFFMPPSDPRFLSTLKQILHTPERGGLTSNGLVYRYDVKKTDDGVGGDEGTFCLCTLWCVEALARAGEYDKAMLSRAVGMFEDFLQYTNHVGLCTEEISVAGEACPRNAVQGFTHVTLISAAYNLSRMLQKVRGG
ncbi:Six-hairpin glycosidase-like protein [Fomitopsis serialis]|uniref:Six-hairpin glycosidase-like protein n=1 Tax=Fomitopsis serialis TaxID=139415 RepID=UPI00200752A3|nr:Six-hairpin glycosidase-like protein [Neoantrodia serialis]KAH9917054.1 Six-hairpin glycosidase-like protein [Neoantrodia serialis]